MPTLSSAVQAIVDRVSQDPIGARNLYRAERIASLTRQLRIAAQRRNLSVRALAKEMGTSPSQVQRIISMSSPANLTIETVLRAADAMGLEVDFHIRDPKQGSYYVQRSAFPRVNEYTCVSTPAAEVGAGEKTKVAFTEGVGMSTVNAFGRVHVAA